MKINHSFTRKYYLKIFTAVFSFMLSSTIFAEILYDGSALQKFCHTPLHSQIVKVFPIGQDLAAIKERKVFRVLLHQKKNRCVISRTERELLEEFALLNDLDLNWIYVENSWDLLPQLLNGEGDIIVAQDQSLSVNIQDEFNFSHVWANAIEILPDDRLQLIEILQFGISWLSYPIHRLVWCYRKYLRAFLIMKLCNA